MNRSAQAFVVTSLLFVNMVIVPVVALSADGYLNVSLLQSPVAPAADAGIQPAAQPPVANIEPSAAAESALAETAVDAQETAQAESVDNTEFTGSDLTVEHVIGSEEQTGEPKLPNADIDIITEGLRMEEGQADAQGENRVQADSAQPAVEATVTLGVTVTDSVGSSALPSTNTPVLPPTSGFGQGLSSALPEPDRRQRISPLPTPTAIATGINTSPLPTPAFTSTSISPPPTATSISGTPVGTPTQTPLTATVTFTPVAPTATRTSAPAITARPTKIVRPSGAPLPASGYPTPVRNVPTPTPEIPASALRLDGYWVQKVIGDRFSSVIYAYANEWLYRSANDGATWTLMSSMPLADDFIMNAEDPNILYSGNGNACIESAPRRPLLKSSNGGLSWVELPSGEGLRPLLTHPFRPEVVVAADCQWLYISEDGGSSWRARPEQASASLWQTYTIVSAAAIYTEDVENPDDLAWHRLYVGAQAANGSGVVAFTDDLGLGWHQITPNVYPSPWGMSTLALDYFNANRTWFADNNGVWYTPDGGVDWRFTYQGLNTDDENGAGALVSMVIHPAGQIYLGSERGLYTKVFDGVEWTKVAGTAFDRTRINTIFFTETNANLLYLNTSDGVHLVKID